MDRAQSEEMQHRSVEDVDLEQAAEEFYLFECPKCLEAMVERTVAGITIEQCINCHGVFLDRAEFDPVVMQLHGWSPDSNRMSARSTVP